MTSSVELRHGLVAALVESGCLRSASLQAAFGAVPRERFVPQLAATLGLAAVYADEALVTRQRDGLPTSSSSQPSIMAEMLEELALRPGHRVLEVGLGTGYNAALLSKLVGPGGAVTSVDIDETLVATAARALAGGGYEVATATADGRLGWPAGAPYDRIIVTASSPQVPRAWWEQLAPDGRLVVPLRLDALQTVAVLARTGTGFRTIRLIPGGFMPLRDTPEAAAAAQPTIMLRVALPGEPVLEINASGPGIATLSGKARRALAGNLLARPSRRALGSVPVWPIIWHTALTSDPLRHIMIYRRPCAAFGLVDPAGGGCAQLTAAYHRGEWSEVAVESYGPAGPVRAALLDHIRAWRAAGAPGLDGLAVEVGYGEVGYGEVGYGEVGYSEVDPPGWALRTISASDGHRISVGWPAGELPGGQ